MIQKDDEMQQYLTDRIQALTEAHTNTLASAEKEQQDDMKMGLSSLAAGIWDTKTELEAVLNLYNKLSK